MKFSYTTNDKFLSKLQKYLGKEKISHVGLLFPKKDIAFDCSTSGFKCQTIKRFKTVNAEVYSIYIDMSEDDEKTCCEILFDMCGSKYNFAAWFWLIWKGFIYRFIGLYPPKKNPYYSKTTFLCTNIADPIAEILLKYELNIYPYFDDAITPEMQHLCYKSQLSEREN